ncbi:LrgB family protein [Acholeplasma equifetale]|uniref:LrgB family protein n=1 Tax=Acholeplasma equifetale TaxID=264634 RepID=UPI00138B11BB|nr:LrgB family protein [Acholeplasma equifetale]
MSNMLIYMTLTLGIFIVFSCIQHKFKLTILNPLLLTSIVIMIILLVGEIPYESYKEETSFITFLIGPATVSLAVPLYENLDVLKKHWKIVLITILVGVVGHALSIGILSIVLGLSDVLAATFIPKSVTTAIAIGISESLGGIKYLTVAIVILTGIIAAMLGPIIFKIFKIDNPIARGLALGSSGHVLGTSKALEYSDLDGSLSTLSLVLTGLITVATAPLTLEIIKFFIK